MENKQIIIAVLEMRRVQKVMMGKLPRTEGERFSDVYKAKAKAEAKVDELLDKIFTKIFAQ